MSQELSALDILTGRCRNAGLVVEVEKRALVSDGSGLLFEVFPEGKMVNVFPVDDSTAQSERYKDMIKYFSDAGYKVHVPGV